ncbi:protein translocase subunit secF [Candidatus Koribacter versatilis Ellin345]|uniref:Protein translocase subunit SecF n=1 Tax=Koribacter versatilis (strain Ellin345) TaxID=204669 RepID=SECF_KORVE|nr:protein translocase subunit SecF [Candidatus Koribacter versatilis]Q1IVE8.1 RecName: Full=Protein translocase subunit SecF [Candidatus Koribacter versatilis Ellin345]ABF39152.1 protein translocase subunit secF [Candidatus Koribacter versatilis Ellin345]
MELFRNTNIDFLGKKWYFLAFSLVFSVAGLISMGARYAKTGTAVPLGVDFKGGTLVYVKFAQTPNLGDIRAAMDRSGLKDPKIQTYGGPANNEVLIALEQKETSEQALDAGKNTIIKALETNPASGKNDLNNVGSTTIRDYLMSKDPLHEVVDPGAKYQQIASQIVDYRDKERGGVLSSVDELQGHVPADVVNALKTDYFTSGFGVRNVEIVGPQVGKQLSNQALLATLYSLGGMLVYLWFRFELIYGIGAVVACFHDTIITVGAFSLLNRDISLTVVAAILTLIGYSMNDTIVVYDRIRENIKLLRRESLADIVNKSINQTLSRTILTSGLTFLTVLSLYVFGGEVLRGFSLALVIGILIGTYSSIAVAAPMLVAYQEWRGHRGTAALPGPAPRKNDRVKVKA